MKHTGSFSACVLLLILQSAAAAPEPAATNAVFAACGMLTVDSAETAAALQRLVGPETRLVYDKGSGSLLVFGPPAALRGWVERVVREGVAFDVGPGGAVTGLLRARAALVVTTGNAGARTEEALGDPVTRFWRDVVFGPAGVGETRRLAFAPVLGSSAEARAGWLEEARRGSATLVGALRAYLGSHRAEQRRPDEPS